MMYIGVTICISSEYFCCIVGFMDDWYGIYMIGGWGGRNATIFWIVEGGYRLGLCSSYHNLLWE